METKEMKKVMISACLVGDNCKYDGKNNYCNDVKKLSALCDLILICPEVFGGLPTPRTPSERKGDKVVNKLGKDVTNAFNSGASLACHIASIHQIQYAVLKENSPSCGVHQIYDGTFSNHKIKGSGVTSERLSKLGIQVFNENEIDQLIEILTK